MLQSVFAISFRSAYGTLLREGLHTELNSLSPTLSPQCITPPSAGRLPHQRLLSNIGHRPATTITACYPLFLEFHRCVLDIMDYLANAVSKPCKMIAGCVNDNSGQYDNQVMLS